MSKDGMVEEPILQWEKDVSKVLIFRSDLVDRGAHLFCGPIANWSRPIVGQPGLGGPVRCKVDWPEITVIASIRESKKRVLLNKASAAVTFESGVSGECTYIGFDKWCRSRSRKEFVISGRGIAKCGAGVAIKGLKSRTIKMTSRSRVADIQEGIRVKAFREEMGETG